MPYRIDLITTDHVYHLYTRSISEFVVFRKREDFNRMLDLLSYYSYDRRQSNRFSESVRSNFDTTATKKLIQLIAYCLMPTHVHFVVKQLKDNGIKDFMKKVLNSYSKYFNIKYKRKGPLWEGRFKNVLVEDDEQLLHLTRYVHLNPVTAYMYEKPDEWKYSSYLEYINKETKQNSMCSFSDIIDINSEQYKEFVCERISDQRVLAKIKKLSLE